MKLSSSPHHGAIHLPSMTHSVEAARSRFGRLASKLRKGTSTFVRQMQIARMQSVLYEMSDAQLAKIGLKRSDIRDRAEFLVNGTTQVDTFKEYDGL